MIDFGNSLDVVKGALIYGRSPYIPLRFAPLVRSPRGAECKALWQFRYGETPMRTALLRRGRSCRRLCHFAKACQRMAVM